MTDGTEIKIHKMTERVKAALAGAASASYNTTN